jgi:HK97 family phage major capsid protein
MMNDSTLKKFKQVKDKYGRPLWQPSLVAGAPDTFGGRPLLINNYMDALQAGVGSPPVTRNTVIFGDLKRYIVRRVKSMSVLRLEERFADFGLVAFLAFARYDGTPA